MDRRYKRVLKDLFSCMAVTRFPAFSAVARARSARYRASPDAMCYADETIPDECVCIVVEPGEGLTTDFFVYIGWSRCGAQVRRDFSQEFFRMLNENPWPRAELPGALVNIEELEGRSAIGPVHIRGPWDELSSIEFQRMTKKDQAARAREIAEVADALSDEELREEVRVAVADVIERINRILPDLRQRLASV